MGLVKEKSEFRRDIDKARVERERANHGYNAMKNAAVERNPEYDKIIKEHKDRINELEQSNVLLRQRRNVLEGRNSREDITEEERAENTREIGDTNSEIFESNLEIEGTSLRSRMKIIITEFFKEHGFTITAIVLAISAIVVTIATNSLSAVSKLAKGVAKGLKEIGKKLAQLLPGMIGAIASFIFKTAGEVFGFLAKNAWLLIVAVVIYFVESLKKKKR